MELKIIDRLKNCETPQAKLIKINEFMGMLTSFPQEKWDLAAAGILFKMIRKLISGKENRVVNFLIN